MSESQTTVSAGVRSLLAQLESYCEKMAPGKRMTEDQINMQQKGLYTILFHVMRQQDANDYRDAFTGVVELFKAHREGALSTALVSRNHYSVKLSTEQRKEFARLVNLFVVMSNPVLVRGFHKQIDLTKTLKHLDEPYLGRAIEHIKALVTAAQSE